MEKTTYSRAKTDHQISTLHKNGNYLQNRAFYEHFLSLGQIVLQTLFSLGQVVLQALSLF